MDARSRTYSYYRVAALLIMIVLKIICFTLWNHRYGFNVNKQQGSQNPLKLKQYNFKKTRGHRFVREDGILKLVKKEEL